MHRSELESVPELQEIRGVPFPADVAFRQLVVTGPPGTGKTTLVSAIGGWPDEGYVDLTARNWWRSRALTFRPRQIHLGLPFEGHALGMSMFEPEWLELEELPELETDRVRIPPMGGRWDPWKWLHRYVFDFLLPPAAAVFEARRERLDLKTHVIDAEVSLDRVAAQLDAYWRVAHHFHHAGMTVYVRDEFGGVPKVFAEPAAAAEVEARRSRGGGRRSVLESYIQRIISPRGYRVLDRFDSVKLRGKKVLIPRRRLPVELGFGDRVLRMYAERPPGTRGAGQGGIRVLDPERYFEQIAPFVRLDPGDTIRFPDEGRAVGRLEKGIPSMLEITNEGSWLTMVDLESPTGTVIRALDDPDEADRIVRDRMARLAGVARVFEGMPPALSPEEARENLERAMEVYAEGTFRPRNRDGAPGGLVELPPDVTPIIVGDLHAEVDNLLLILTEGRFLDELEAGTAALVLLGDVVHPEVEVDLMNMESSLLITDMVARLITAFPGRVFYLRGNHDTFSEDMTKGGVSQGRIWRETVEEARGAAAVEQLARFYDSLPYVAVGEGFIACHAGPPRRAVSRADLVDVHSKHKLMHQLTWNRVQSQRHPGGYTKRDVRGMQKALDPGGSARLIVSHNPGRTGSTAIRRLSGIGRHDLVYSAKRDRVSVMTRIEGEMVPLTYPGGTFLDALSGVPDAADGEPG